MKKIFIFAVVIISAFAGTFGEYREASAAGMPPLPIIYIGNVTVAGLPAPEGALVVGKIGDYTSNPVAVTDGRIVGLTVGPPDTSYFRQTITFMLNDAVVAEETDVFETYGLPVTRRGFNLTFPAIPTPTPEPTSTPLPTATPLPSTATPVPTSTPIVVGPVVYNGVVVVSGGTVPDNSTLTARIGGYESRPVPVTGGEFISLIVDVNDPLMTNKEVTFYLNGFLSRTTAVYKVGDTIRNVDLIFMDLPEAVAIDAGKPPAAPPTAVPTEIPTQQAAVAVATAAPVATAIVAAPIAAPIETATPIVVVITATPGAVESMAPEPESGGGCMAVSEIDPLTGSANVLAMVGPLLLLVAYRGFRKFL